MKWLLVLLLVSIASAINVEPLTVQIGDKGEIARLNFWNASLNAKASAPLDYAITNYLDHRLFLETAQGTVAVISIDGAAAHTDNNSTTVGENASASTPSPPPAVSLLSKQTSGAKLRRGAKMRSMLRKEENQTVTAAANSTGSSATGAGGTAAADTAVAGAFATNTMHVTSALMVQATGPIGATSPQWRLVHHDDFDTTSAAELAKWSAPVVQTCAGSGSPSPQVNSFLGGYCKFSGADVHKTFAGLPANHTRLRVQASFHFIDRWMGQAAYLLVDGQHVWVKTHRHCTKIFQDSCRGMNFCGEAEYHDTLGVAIDVTVAHSTPEVTLTFGSTLDALPCDHSWGVDDVRVSTIE